MRCLNCLCDNPPGQIHCVKCGMRLDLRPEEVHAMLAEKAQKEQQRKTEYYTSTLLTFAIALFVVALTVLIISGAPPEDTYFVPYISKEADYLKVKVPFLFYPEWLVFPWQSQY